MKRLTRKQKLLLNKHRHFKTEGELAQLLGIDLETVTYYFTQPNKSYSVAKNPNIFTFIKNNVLIIALLGFLTLFVYHNNLQSQFISGDDYTGFVENLSVHTLSTALKSFHLQDIVYALSYTLFRTSPLPLHAVALINHITVSILVFICLYILFGPKISAIASFIFVVLPVNSEPVSWISGSAYLYHAIAFYILLVLFVSNKDRKNTKYYILFSLLYLTFLFVLQSIWLVVFPFIFLVIDHFILNTPVKLKNLYLHILLICISLLYGVVFMRETIFSRFEFLYSGTTKMENSSSILVRIPYSVFMMLKLYIFPDNLSIYHEGEILSKSLYMIMISITVLFFTTVVYFYKKNRVISGLLFILIVSILPVFSPVVVAWFIAERYLYLASPFFCVLLAMFILKLGSKVNFNEFPVIVTLVLLIIYSVVTFERTKDWRNSKTLWSATARVAVNSPRVYNNLGDVFAQEHNYNLAISYFEHAIELDPNYSDAMHNLATMYIQINDINKAEELYLKSIQINPNLYQSYTRIGAIEYTKGNVKAARDYFTKALEINPNYDIAKKALVELEGK